MFFATTQICRVAIATASSSLFPPHLLETRPRAVFVIGGALLWCHQGDRMMKIWPRERKRNRWNGAGAPRKPPPSHWWVPGGSQTVVGPFTHPSEEQEGLGCIFPTPSPPLRRPPPSPPPLPRLYGSRRGADWLRGDTVGLHPRVWRLGLHRGARGRRGRARDGEGETKRRRSVNEVSGLFALGPLSGSGLQPEKLPSAVGANPAISQRPQWSNFVLFSFFFLMKHSKGWAQQMKNHARPTSPARVSMPHVHVWDCCSPWMRVSESAGLHGGSSTMKSIFGAPCLCALP